MKLSSRFEAYKANPDPLSVYLSSLRFDIAYMTHWPQQDHKQLNDIVSTHIKVVLQAGGTADLTSQNACFHLEAGSVLFIPPYTVYSAHTHENVDSYELFFNIHPILREQEFLGKMNLTQITHFPNLLPAQVLQSIRDCYDAVQEKSPGSYAQLQSLLMSLLVRFVRMQNAEGAVPSASLKEQAVIEQLFAYLQEHMAEPVRVDQICEALKVSQSYLYRCSRHIMNCSTAQLITRQKMRHAKTLLKDPSLSIAEVADALGYDSFYFSNQFKKHFHQSPTEYRKTLILK